MMGKILLISLLAILLVPKVFSINITATLQAIEEGMIYVPPYTTTIIYPEPDIKPTIQLESAQLYPEYPYIYGNITFTVVDNEQRTADCYIYTISLNIYYWHHLGTYNTNTRYDVSFNITPPEVPQEAYLLCIVGPGTDMEQLVTVPLFRMHKLTYRVMSVLQYVVITLPQNITTNKIYSISISTLDNREVPIRTEDIIYKNERTLIIRLPTLANYIYIYTIV